jgi:hypothetical protein
VREVGEQAFRAGKHTVSQARRLLGIPSRYEMDGFFKAHGVFLDLTLFGPHAGGYRKDTEIARSLLRSHPKHRPGDLSGSVLRFDNPFEPVAAEDRVTGL